MRLKPTSDSTWFTPGCFSRNDSTLCTTASVRCSNASSGSSTEMAKYPLSSVCRNAVGTTRLITKMRTTMTRERSDPCARVIERVLDAADVAVRHAGEIGC